MQLIEINGKTIKLCSGMTEESFAKQLNKELDENARVGSKIDDCV